MRSPKLMLLAATASALTLFGAASAQAAVITGLFNTGTDASGAALTGGDGAIDPHYTIVATDNGVVPRQAVTYYNTAYAANDANSEWISLSANGFPGSNTTTYELTFSLAGLNAATASISGLWGVDNDASITLNGAATGVVLGGGDNQGNFSSLHSFTLSSGFVSGVNKIDFVVTDQGPPTAFRVDDLQGTAAAVPEPASWAMMLVGFFGLGATVRRRKGVAAVA